MKKEVKFNYQLHIGKDVECIKGKFKGYSFMLVGHENNKFIAKIKEAPLISDNIYFFKPSELREVIVRTYYEYKKLK